MQTIKGKDLKAIVAEVDDEADVLVTMNGDKGNALSVYSCNKDENGDLLFNVVHYCAD